MTQREALKLALEALEEFGEHYDWCHQFPTYAFPENYPPCNCGYDKAITAIKEALREHAMYEVQRLGQEIQPEPPQRTWVGLTDDEIDQGLLRSDYAFKTAEAWRAGVVFAMTKLKEKNT